MRIGAENVLWPVGRISDELSVRCIDGAWGKTTPVPNQTAPTDCVPGDMLALAMYRDVVPLILDSRAAGCSAYAVAAAASDFVNTHR